MAILKIRNENGDVIEIPTLKGDAFTYEDFTEEQLENLKPTECGYFTYKHINTKTGIYNINTNTPYTTGSHAFYEFEETPAKIKINGCAGGNATNYPLCAFYDADNNLISSVSDSGVQIDYIAKVPSNAKKVLINDNVNRGIAIGVLENVSAKNIGIHEYL